MNINDIIFEMENYGREENVPIINEKGKKVFCDILKKYRPKKALEIGTAIGYSAVLTFLYGHEDLKITTIELDEKRQNMAKYFLDKTPYKNRISFILGDASLVLEKLQVDEKFDFIFIDAAKGQYVNYLNLVLPHLENNGIILADNVLFRGYVKGMEAVPKRYKTIVKRLREYLKIVEDDTRFETTIFENGDGLALTKLKKRKEEL